MIIWLVWGHCNATDSSFSLQLAHSPFVWTSIAFHQHFQLLFFFFIIHALPSQTHMNTQIIIYIFNSSTLTVMTHRLIQYFLLHSTSVRLLVCFMLLSRVLVFVALLLSQFCIGLTSKSMIIFGILHEIAWNIDIFIAGLALVTTHILNWQRWDYRKVSVNYCVDPVKVNPILIGWWAIGDWNYPFPSKSSCLQFNQSDCLTELTSYFYLLFWSFVFSFFSALPFFHRSTPLLMHTIFRINNRLCAILLYLYTYMYK